MEYEDFINELNNIFEHKPIDSTDMIQKYDIKSLWENISKDIQSRIDEELEDQSINQEYELQDKEDEVKEMLATDISNELDEILDNDIYDQDTKDILQEHLEKIKERLLY